MRIRVRFTKQGKVRFTSHRDVARLWERALRRATLPVASTEGFSPRPKMHFGLALSTGHESLGEYLDIDLREPEGDDVDLDALPAMLSPLLPVGLDIHRVAAIDRSMLSLQEAVVACDWRLEVVGVDTSTLQEAVEAMLAAEQVTVTRERKGKEVSDDIRPAMLALHVAADGWLEAELATQPRGVRPSELVAALSTFVARPDTAGDGAPLEEGRVCRTHQWIVLDGARQEPLPPGATWAPHAQARAS
jgi:radical SAM-linked protein